MGFARRIEYGSFFTLFLVLSSWQFSEAKDYFNVIEKLHTTLLQDYNKQIRPVEIHTEAVNLEAGFHLTNLNFDEISAHFSAQGYFFMKWKDPRFVWDPVDYDGLKSIHLPSETVWTPDLEVYNNPGRLGDDRSFAVTQPVLINSDGSVLFVPLSNLISVCNPDLTDWPYDTQVCTTKIGSWTHDARKIAINLRYNSSTVETDDYEASKSEWNLLQTSAEVERKTYPCCPDEPYESIIFKFTLQRRSPSARFTIIIPTIGIAVLTLISFFIPPTASAKFTIGAVNLILLCLLHFESILPPSESVPRIVLFHGETVLLVILSMLVSVVTMNLAQKSRPPPNCIQKCLSSSFGRFMGASHLKRTDKSDLAIQEKVFVDEKESLNNEINNGNATQCSGRFWIALSIVLHRLMFIIYCIIFAVMMYYYIFN